MANFDTMMFTGTGSAKAIVDDLEDDSFVRSAAPNNLVTAMKITPWSTNIGEAMYWGRSNVTTIYGDRLIRGVAAHLDFSGPKKLGSIDVNNVFMIGDVDGDRASIVFTLE